MDTQMQPIGRIDEDPYLIKKYKSLKHFYKGIKALGHPFPPDLAKEFFAHHDCPFQAITSIRQNGYDPKRRFGQVHEYGEYFGVTANISHGYFQKGNTQQRFSQMIIAYLLQCAQITTKEIFFMLLIIQWIGNMLLICQYFLLLMDKMLPINNVFS